MASSSANPNYKGLHVDASAKTDSSVTAAQLSEIDFFPIELLSDPELPIKVKLLRKTLGKNMSQRELSRRSGISQTMLSRLESGTLDVSLGMIESICRVFSITPLQLSGSSIGLIRIEDSRFLRASDARLFGEAKFSIQVQGSKADPDSVGSCPVPSSESGVANKPG